MVYLFIYSENCRFVLKVLDWIAQSVILKAVKQSTKQTNKATHKAKQTKHKASIQDNKSGRAKI